MPWKAWIWESCSCRYGERRYRWKKISEKTQLLIFRASLQREGNLPQKAFRLSGIQNPVCDLVFLQQQGHAVMDGFHGFVCGGGKDYEVFPVPIVPAASCQKQSFSVLSPEGVFSLFLIPLIEGGRGNGDASVEDAFPEKGSVCGSLAAGVDNQAFALLLLYGKAPPEPGTGDASSCRKKDGGLVRWVYIRAADSLQGSGGFPAQFFICLFYQLFYFLCR